VNEAQWLQKLEDIGAINRADKKRHFILRSGRHSDLYINMSALVSFPNMLEQACADLIARVGLFTFAKTWCIGSEKGAITPAHEVARQIKARFGYTEKAGENMELKRFFLTDEDHVYLIEDVITTGSTTLKTLRAVEEAGGTVLDPMLALCNRGLTKEVNGVEIVSLVFITGNDWASDQCPLCRNGSIAYANPKELLRV
jgi:orotate phosphoribosyltransferase